MRSREVKRRWRDYRTAGGRRPVKDFFDELSDADAAAVVAPMKEVQELGMSAARHLRVDVYEVRAEGDRQIFRVLFATEGRHDQIFSRSRASRRRRGRRLPRRFASPSGGSPTGAAELAHGRDDLSRLRDTAVAIVGA